MRYLVELDQKINIHANNEEGFILACTNGHIDVVRYLVELYQNININADDNESFILDCEIEYEAACEMGHLDVVRYFVEFINIDLDDGFKLACSYGHMDIARYLVEFHQSIKYRNTNRALQLMPGVNYDEPFSKYKYNLGRQVYNTRESYYL